MRNIITYLLCLIVAYFISNPKTINFGGAFIVYLFILLCDWLFINILIKEIKSLLKSPLKTLSPVLTPFRKGSWANGQWRFIIIVVLVCIGFGLNNGALLENPLEALGAMVNQE